MTRRPPDGIDARCTMPSPPHTKRRSTPASRSVAHLLRSELALGDLAPQRLVDAVFLQRVPQRAQTAAELLAGMRDHADGGHRGGLERAVAAAPGRPFRSRSSDTATALLVASTANSRAPHPSSTLARTSVR